MLTLNKYQGEEYNITRRSCGCGGCGGGCVVVIVVVDLRVFSTATDRR